MDHNEKRPSSPSRQYIDDVAKETSSNEEIESSDPVFTWKRLTAIGSLAMIYVGSQLPLYFAGGCLSYMAEDLSATRTAAWLPVSYSLVIAAITPFCGYLEDMFGKRNFMIAGCALCIIGEIVVATAHEFGQAVAGMSITGAGAGITEITSLAGVAELLPISKRGYGLAAVTMTIFPFTPYVMYMQMLAVYATWRWAMYIPLIICGVATVGILLTYWPKAAHGTTKTRGELVKEMDFVGGLLSISGITLLLVGLQSGGYTHPWRSAHVLCPLIIGVLLIFTFVIWEWKFAKNPMVPAGLFEGQVIVASCFAISFVAGMNFYSLLNFYPLTFSAVYNPAPVQVGWKGLGYGMSVTLGATTGNYLISALRGRNRAILTTAAVLMTAFGGALAAITPETPGMAVAFGTIAGFGVGFLVVPPIVVAACVVPDHLVATVTALVLTMRFVGGSIGYTIYSVVFAQKLTGILPTEIARFAVQAGLPETDAPAFVTTILTSPTKAQGLAGVTPAILAAAAQGSQWAYSKALAYVWYTSIPFGTITVIICALLPEIRQYLTERVAVNIARK